MPRRGRLHIPGGCYHVIGRGLERRYIFDSASDKREFLSRFGSSLVRAEAQCLAWALMSNHYHFLVRVGTQPLAKLMAPTLGGYAGYYNRRYRRSGYVFQNRFTSILCNEEPYLLELVRYIHLNPVRAKMVDSIKDLNKYPWTGHAGIFGRYHQKWHSVDEVLKYFDEHRAHARRKYLEFVQDGEESSSELGLSGGGLIRSYGGWETIRMLRREHVLCIGDERILGQSEFVERVLEEDELKIESKSRLHREGWNLNKLVGWACEHCGIREHEIYRRSREGSVSKAKALICHIGVERLGLTAAEVAKHLGISRPAVSKWVSKGRVTSQAEAGIEMFD